MTGMFAVEDDQDCSPAVTVKAHHVEDTPVPPGMRDVRQEPRVEIPLLPQF